MIVECAHRTIESQLYEALAKGKKLPAATGDQEREMIQVCRERGLPMDVESPDWQWLHSLLELPDKVRRGKQIDLSRYAWTAFDAMAPTRQARLRNRWEPILRQSYPIRSRLTRRTAMLGKPDGA